MNAGKHTSGQALLLALLLLAAGTAGLFQLFSSGQLVAGKTRLTNAVDAAAYSAALTQARALNFLAFTNRAMVAHQVAMAHDVTLASWAKFGDEQGQQFARRHPPVTIIASFFGPSHGVAYASSRRLGGRLAGEAQWGSGALANAFSEHDRVVHEVLVRAQLAVQSAMHEQRNATLREVLAANYSQEDAPGFELLSDGLPGFVARYGGDARQRLKRMVEASGARYGFLQPRDDTSRSLLPLEPRCPMLKHELRRRGATALLGLDTWRSVDTQSYHALRSNKWVGCYYREYAMGYGALKSGGGDAGDGIEHVEDPPDDFSDESFWQWVQKHTQWDLLAFAANPFGNSLALASLTTWTSSGLPTYVEIRAAGGQGAASMRVALRGWRRPEGAQGGQKHRGWFEFATPLGSMAAASAAETFHVRPVARSDGRTEHPSLFMPYWQARLVALSDAERAAARAAQGAS